MQTENAAFRTPMRNFDESGKIFGQSSEMMKKSRISSILIFPEIVPMDY